ncbi:MAG: hypothetical protein LQ350_008079 [Teloschistes chrysophthalmus]|nr:MAG: hypothetical protein LQ350_008079 [Niorma chrysophthalma]
MHRNIQLCVSLGVIALAYASAVPGHQQVRRQSGPVPPDTIKDCTYFYDSQPGDTCVSIVGDWGLSQEQFKTYNPSVKSDCSGLVIGTAYCVEENYGNGPAPPETTATTSSKTTATTTSATPTGPSPVQSGINAQCKQFYKVQDGDTCAGIVDKYHTFTLQNLYSWNPAIGSSCGSLLAGYYVCVGIPGTPTAPPTTTSAGATPGPSPTQSGLAANCKKFYKVQDGDECGKIVASYGTFSLADFYTWNPAIGTNCGSLISGYYVCVGLPSTPTIRPSTTRTSTSATPTGPSPTQSGIISSCTKYYKAVSGDSCEVISNEFRTFTVAQFESWNPAVGPSCTRLFLDYYYCVAILGTPTTRSTTKTTSTKTTSTTSSGPSPTQTGIISSCRKYYKTVSGDTCQVISDRYGTFSVAQFISWNPAVKSDCSQLYLGYYYCIAIPGTPTARTTTSTTSKTPTPTPKGPQPQQPGIVSNCNKYYLVKSGDSCYTIEQSQSVSAPNFQKWNTGIKADCSNLFVGYYVCTGVS